MSSSEDSSSPASGTLIAITGIVLCGGILILGCGGLAFFVTMRVKEARQAEVRARDQAMQMEVEARERAFKVRAIQEEKAQAENNPAPAQNQDAIPESN